MSVLVVGARPVGLMLALELHHHGMSCRLYGGVRGGVEVVPAGWLCRLPGDVG